MKRTLVIASLALACGAGGARDTSVSRDTAPSAAVTAAPESVPATAAVVPAAPAAPAAPQGPGKDLVATWDIFPTGVVGPHLSIEISSADGGRFSGRLVRALAGDVMLEPDRFAPFSGSIAPDSAFSFRIEFREKGPPPAEFRGRLVGGELHFTHFVWGGEQQVVAGRTWTGRKAK